MLWMRETQRLPYFEVVVSVRKFHHRYLPNPSIAVPYLAEKSHGYQIPDLPSTFKFGTVFYQTPQIPHHVQLYQAPKQMSSVLSASTNPAYGHLSIEPFSLPLFEVSCETKAAQHHTRLFRTMPEGEVVVVRATLHNIMGIPFIKE